MKIRILYRIITLLTLLLTGCANPHKVKTTADYYNKQHSNENKRVYVFVHGIFGDPYETWKNENGSYFFDLIKEDTSDDFKDSDIFVFGYPSGFNGKTSFTIGEAANELAIYMRHKKVTDYNEINFVAHSMGGLVTLTYLLQNPDVAKKVPLVFLYSTPLSGSDIAKIGSIFSDNPGLAAMYPNDSESERNIYLESLIDNWKNELFNKRIPTVIRCAYEKEAILGKIIVNKESATKICEGISFPIPANHRKMFTTSGNESPSFVALKDAVRITSAKQPKPSNIDKKPKLHVEIFSADSPYLRAYPYPLQGYHLMINNTNSNSASIRDGRITFVFKGVVKSVTSRPNVMDGSPISGVQIHLKNNEGSEFRYNEQPIETSITKHFSLVILQDNINNSITNSNAVTFQCERWPENVIYDAEIVVDLAKKPQIYNRGANNTFQGGYYYEIDGVKYSEIIKGVIPEGSVSVLRSK